MCQLLRGGDILKLSSINKILAWYVPYLFHTSSLQAQCLKFGRKLTMKTNTEKIETLIYHIHHFKDFFPEHFY